MGDLNLLGVLGGQAQPNPLDPAEYERLKGQNVDLLEQYINRPTGPTLGQGLATALASALPAALGALVGGKEGLGYGLTGGASAAKTSLEQIQQANDNQAEGSLLELIRNRQQLQGADMYSADALARENQMADQKSLLDYRLGPDGVETRSRIAVAAARPVRANADAQPPSEAAKAEVSKRTGWPVEALATNGDMKLAMSGLKYDAALAADIAKQKAEATVDAKTAVQDNAANNKLGYFQVTNPAIQQGKSELLDKRIDASSALETQRQGGRLELEGKKQEGRVDLEKTREEFKTKLVNLQNELATRRTEFTDAEAQKLATDFDVPIEVAKNRHSFSAYLNGNRAKLLQEGEDRRNRQMDLNEAKFSPPPDWEIKDGGKLMNPTDRKMAQETLSAYVSMPYAIDSMIDVMKRTKGGVPMGADVQILKDAIQTANTAATKINNAGKALTGSEITIYLTSLTSFLDNPTSSAWRVFLDKARGVDPITSAARVGADTRRRILSEMGQYGIQPKNAPIPLSKLPNRERYPRWQIDQLISQGKVLPEGF